MKTPCTPAAPGSEWVYWWGRGPVGDVLDYGFWHSRKRWCTKKYRDDAQRVPQSVVPVLRKALEKARPLLYSTEAWA